MSNRSRRYKIAALCAAASLGFASLSFADDSSLYAQCSLLINTPLSSFISQYKNSHDQQLADLLSSCSSANICRLAPSGQADCSSKLTNRVFLSNFYALAPSSDSQSGYTSPTVQHQLTGSAASSQPQVNTAPTTPQVNTTPQSNYVAPLNNSDSNKNDSQKDSNSDDSSNSIHWF